MKSYQTIVLAALTGLLACKSSTTEPTDPPNVVSIIAGNNQTVVVATSATDSLVVRVVDENGAPVHGIRVGFASKIGGLVSLPDTTDANGQTRALFTAGTLTGTDSVTASTSTSTTNAIFVFTVNPGVPNVLRKLAGDGQIASPGAALSFPFVVDVKDRYSNNVSGVSIVWTTDNGTLNVGSVATDSTGQAKATLTLPTTAGDSRVTAHVDGLTDVIFIATAR